MEKEKEYLLGMLRKCAEEVNKTFQRYHASVDKSGAVPQLVIQGKDDKKR